MEPTPSGRVQIRGRGELMHPGNCALCGSGHCDEGYVDVGVYYDYEGQVYFCWTCTEEIIAVVRGLTSEEAAFLKAQVEETALKLRAAEAENEQLRTSLANYDSVFSGLADRGVINSASSQPEPESAPTGELVSSTVTGEPVVTESGSSEGHSEPVRPKRRNVSRTATIEL